MMKYRILGSTGLRVSVVGVGTWQFGGEWGKVFTVPEVTAMLARAYELGINLIDTAECYGDHTSERLIGEALQMLGRRKDFIVATKFGHHFHGCFQRTDERTAPDIQKQLDDSLLALRTDYIDLHQYHSWADAQFDNTEVRTVLEKALQAGKVRHVGNSISPNDKTYQVQRSADYHVGAIQVVYNRLQREPEAAVLPMCAQLKLGVLARVPLASGYLSGKYKPGAAFATDDVRGQWHKPADRDAKLTQVAHIQQTEVPPGVPMARWALAWCLKTQAVTSVIPGCKSVAQVEENAAAAELVAD